MIWWQKINKHLQTSPVFLLLALWLLSFSGKQTTNPGSILIDWKPLQDGLSYAETDAPVKSQLGDSKITILKIDPSKYKFRMLCASELGQKTRTAKEWSDEFGQEIIVNAGMYHPSDNSTSKGYLKNFSHFNNKTFNGSYNSMICFNPADSLLPGFRLDDLKCANGDSLMHRYNSCSQEMRMIDCNRQPLQWNKNAKQECSMVMAAMDLKNNLLLIFCRSPYTQNAMIKFLLDLPLDIRNASYLEGGPEASLYVSLAGFSLDKFGSYVTDFHPNDNNDHSWKLPNVIGIKKK